MDTEQHSRRPLSHPPLSAGGWTVSRGRCNVRLGRTHPREATSTLQLRRTRLFWARVDPSPPSHPPPHQRLRGLPASAATVLTSVAAHLLTTDFLRFDRESDTRWAVWSDVNTSDGRCRGCRGVNDGAGGGVLPSEGFAPERFMTLRNSRTLLTYGS